MNEWELIQEEGQVRPKILIAGETGLFRLADRKGFGGTLKLRVPCFFITGTRI